MPDPDPEIVSISDARIVLENGDVCRVTSWLDIDGDETADFREAVFAVAQRYDGVVIVVDITERATLH